MAAVKHLGLFPWCPYQSREQFQRQQNVSDADFEVFKNILEGLKQPIFEAVGWYWRVKTWQATGQFEAQLIGNTAVTIGYQYTFKRACEFETELVCAPLLERQEELLEYSVPGLIGSNSMDDAEFNIGVISRSYGPSRSGILAPVQDNEQQIYNWLDLSFTGSNTPEVIAGSIESVQPSSEGVEEFQVNITAFEKTYSVPCFKTLEAELEIQAVEYWPYDPEDGGGPIYDITTGAQQRAFPD